jgi:hypothetical protein
MAKTKAFSLLQAAGGQTSLHSPIGQALQTTTQQSHPTQAGAQSFVQAEYTVDLQSIGPGSDIVFPNPGYGDIAYNQSNGFFRLLPNTKYQLTAHFALNNYSTTETTIVIEWVDANTNAVLHAGHGARLTPSTNPNDVNAQPSADTFHQTGGDVQDVKLRVTSGADSADVLSGMALVKEI